MKYLIVLMFLINLNFLYSQSKNDEIIILEEVIITDKIKANKKFTYKTKGKDKASLSVTDNTIFLSRIEIDEKITLKSVNFFFNNREKVFLSNTVFELIILNENNLNKPSNPFRNKNLKFEVKPSNNEEIQLNLSMLNLIIEKPFFIGLKKISAEGKLDFSINLNRKKGESIYLKNKLGDWQIIEDSNIKLEIGYEKD